MTRASLHRVLAGPFRMLALCACLLAAAPGAAQAQSPPAAAPYAPDTPVKGALYRDGSTERYLLGGQWLSRADPADAGVGAGLWRGVASSAGWSPVTVPNADNAGDFSNASMAGYVYWYRKDFRLPAPGLARAWIIRFESVNYRATVWLNGRRVGGHVGGYVPFELDLKPRRGVNRLIVRVDGRRTAADLPPGGYGSSPVGGWWNFGGILREVYLRAVNSVDFEQVQVRPVLPCARCAADVQEQVTLRNLTGKPAAVHLRGGYGGRQVDFGAHVLPPSSTWVATAHVRVPRPHLWSLDDPYLYRATLTLSGPRRARLGGYVTYSGIRSIAVVGGRLLLNGRTLSLRGVGLHEQDLAEGAALDPAHYARLFGWVRALHATIIRSHYPLDQQLLEDADRNGVLVWSEVPVYQVDSQYMIQPVWQSVASAMLQTNILANENHPSVALWSIGNELATPPDGPEASYIATAAALARSLDPTRPVAMAISDWPGVPCQAAYAPLDVIGFNDYFGWYDAGIGGTADRDGLGPFLDSLRACYPAKALFVSEFGFEANRTGPIEERGTYAFQSDAIAYHLGVFAQKPWLSGAILWALQDFACRPGWGGGNPWSDPPFFHKGVLDLSGQPKPSFAVVQAAYGATRQIAPAPGRAATGRPG